MNRRRGLIRKLLGVALAVALLAGVLLVPLPGGETRVVNTVTIDRSPEQVFDYVTRPANWPKWHPSSLAVSGATDHSLQLGEQVSEDYVVAGRRGTALWTVTVRDAPRRWVIAAKSAGGGGTVSYVLTPLAQGTHFERTLEYRFPNLLLRLLDRLVYRTRIEAESSEALRRLKQQVEAG